MKDLRVYADGAKLSKRELRERAGELKKVYDDAAEAAKKAAKEGREAMEQAAEAAAKGSATPEAKRGIAGLKEFTEKVPDTSGAAKELRRGGVPGFKSAAQRKQLEGFKNSLKRQLKGKQLEAFKKEIEDSKIGEQFTDKAQLQQIFDEIVKNIKP